MSNDDNAHPADTLRAPRPVLPVQPRLRADRPVLWRTPHTVQLGVDPRHAVVVAGLSPGLAALLRDLDGTRPTADLLTKAGDAGVPEADARGLLAELVEVGLIEEARTLRRRPSDARFIPASAPDTASWAVASGRSASDLLAARTAATVVVHGGGRIGVAVAVLLAAAGVGRVHVAPDGAVLAADTGTGYLPSDVGRPRAAAAAEAVRRVAPSVALGPPTVHHPSDLAVLADQLVVDPVLVADLAARRVPHLPARVRDGVGVVGPLVLPGRTSCLRCADLHRADADPCWPALAGQLLGRAGGGGLGVSTATAALAAEQALAALTGAAGGRPVPAVLEATLEIDPLGGRLDRRRWVPHPDCPCGAAGSRGTIAR